MFCVVESESESNEPKRKKETRKYFGKMRTMSLNQTNKKKIPFFFIVNKAPIYRIHSPFIALIQPFILCSFTFIKKSLLNIVSDLLLFLLICFAFTAYMSRNFFLFDLYILPLTKPINIEVWFRLWFCFCFSSLLRFWNCSGEKKKIHFYVG